MQIAILTGGQTGERAVSIASAHTIESMIDFGETRCFVLPEDLSKFLASYHSFDIAIPMIHGRGGEDGSIQGLLEHLDTPYIFSEVGAHAVAIDKVLTKKIVKDLGCLVPQKADPSDFPVFVKPRFGGSSLATGLCRDASEYNTLTQIESNEYMVERPVIGREFTIGVIEVDGQARALPIIEIITPPGTFFDYQRKYDASQLAQEICPADIDGQLVSQLVRQAIVIHQALGVRHVSRSDFIVDQQGQIYFLEINTIPGMTATSLLPKMITVAGLDFKMLLQSWCRDAVRRARSQRQQRGER